MQQDLKMLGVDENMALDRKRWRKIIAGPTPIEKIWTMNENDDDD